MTFPLDTLAGPALWLAILVALYVPGALLISAGILRLPRSFRLDGPALPRVSVIVTARNEQHDLPACLAALERLDYPVEKLEVLLVDDRSTDATAALIADACARHAHFRALSTAGWATHLRAKARGVAWAARHATGEWLFITDADAVVPAQWVRHLLSRADARTGMMGGMLVTRAHSAFGRVEGALAAFIMPFGAGIAGHGGAFPALGPNMAIRRATYEAAGGLEAARFGVAEDLALFGIVRAAGQRAIAYADPDTVVACTQVPSPLHLLSQYRRWLLGGFEGPPDVWGGILFLILYHFALSWLLLGAWAVVPGAWGGAWGAKLVADAAILTMAGRRLGQPGALGRLPWLELGALVGFALLPVTLLVSRGVRWRGAGYVEAFD